MNLNDQDCAELNTIATKYRMMMGDFTKLLWNDHNEAEKIRLEKDALNERAELAVKIFSELKTCLFFIFFCFQGKQTRRERRFLKDQRLLERGFHVGLPSFAKPDVDEKSKRLDDSDS